MPMTDSSILWDQLHSVGCNFDSKKQEEIKVKLNAIYIVSLMVWHGIVKNIFLSEHP